MKLINPKKTQTCGKSEVVEEFETFPMAKFLRREENDIWVSLCF
jgi:hypothetical protein